MAARIKVHECSLSEFGDPAGGFRQKRYPGCIVIPMVNREGRYWFTVVDESDYPVVSGYRWSPRINQRGRVYARTTISGETVGLHTLITGYSFTDHIDNDPLNNRRSNLRSSDDSTNVACSKIQSNNTSGFKGVSWHKPSGKWMAHIQFKGHLMHLGLFADPADAARAYDQMARKLFGEFARPNFPEFPPEAILQEVNTK